jgi:hypothetical protein
MTTPELIRVKLLFFARIVKQIYCFRRLAAAAVKNHLPRKTPKELVPDKQ